MKVSRVEEAELKAEAYYYEVCRLKDILRKQNGEVEEMLLLRWSLCVCVCVCVRVRARVCACACARVCVRALTL